MREICVQGLGFVGAAMAVATADAVTEEGHPIYRVTGVDQTGQESERRIESINQGKFPFRCGDLSLLEATKRAHAKRQSIRDYRGRGVFLCRHNHCGH